MSISAAMKDASFAAGAARRSAREPFAGTCELLTGAREVLAVALLLYGPTSSAQTLAGDSHGSSSSYSPNPLMNIQPMVGGTPLPFQFVPNRTVEEGPQFSTTEFGARKPEFPGVGAPSSAQMFPSAPSGSGYHYQEQALRSTSAWQRLADYRAQGRVQLLTLWQSRSSTVSVQAGKHGGPSLQWSSRIMNRGGATRGLLDRFVPSSLSASGLGSKLAAHRSDVVPPSKAGAIVPAVKTP